jgi:hypothetical protein
MCASSGFVSVKKDVVLLFGSALSTEVCNWATAAGAKISEIANMDALTE